MAAEEKVIAEARYSARRKNGTDAKRTELVIRLHEPALAAAGSVFEGMWLCRCSISGPVEYSEAFPGVDSFQALEYSLVIVAGYMAYLCKEFDVNRNGRDGEPLPLGANSMLAGMLQGKPPEPPPG
jgi:hypothetical protein